MAAAAGREQSLGEFSKEIRGKVAEKVAEVLSPRGSPAEISGTVTFAADDRFFIQRGQDGLHKGRLCGRGDLRNGAGMEIPDAGRACAAQLCAHQKLKHRVPDVGQRQLGNRGKLLRRQGQGEKIRHFCSPSSMNLIR